MFPLAPGELVRRQSEGCLQARMGPTLQKSTKRGGGDRRRRESCRPQYFARCLRSVFEKLVDHPQITDDGGATHGRVEVSRLSVWEHQFKAFLATARQRRRKRQRRGDSAVQQ